MGMQKTVLGMVLHFPLCKRKGYKKNDVVYGNIPIKRALSIIAERGDASDVAKSILAKDNDRNGI